MKKIIFLTITIALLLSACHNRATVVVPSDNSQQKKKDSILLEINKKIVDGDQKNIQNYIQSNNLQMQNDGSGMWYHIFRYGKDTVSPKTGNTVYLEYKLNLLDGTPCYSSDSLGIKKFKVDYSYVERGLNDGVKLMHAGDSAIFIIPHYLAWGLTGDGNKIPHGAIIVYYVKLLKIE